jgi:hypothetical protein
MNKKIELMTATGIETNPQKVAELLNAHFVEAVNEIIKQNKYPSHTQTAQSKIRVLSILNRHVAHHGTRSRKCY